MGMFKCRRQRTEDRGQRRIGTLLFLIFLLFVSLTFADDNPVVVERSGEGKVQLIKYSGGKWQLFVDGKPYLVKGVVYEPVKVGEKLTSSNIWMNYDFNKNGINDTAYESWIDKNKNNKKDANEKTVGDFKLLQDMGANTIRIYHPSNINKRLLKDLYHNYGIRVMMGNFLGAYCWGSGASWKQGTDYTNLKHLENMLSDVKKMVLEFKDEPYILSWMLGNENDALGSYENSTFNNTNARLYPKEFAEFVNKVAQAIHVLDPDHPVGVSLAYTSTLKYIKRYAPAINFVGFNAYRGPFGFGSLFRTVKMDIDKPLVITEYGVDSYNQKKQREDEDFQVRYHKGCWEDIENNSFLGNEVGNAIGGFAYTWLDSWWFCGSAGRHDTKKGAWQGPAQDGWFNDEWLGMCSQGNGRNSPFLRQLKKVYSFYSKEWGGSNDTN